VTIPARRRVKVTAGARNTVSVEEMPVNASFGADVANGFTMYIVTVLSTDLRLAWLNSTAGNCEAME